MVPAAVGRPTRCVTPWAQRWNGSSAKPPGSINGNEPHAASGFSYTATESATFTTPASAGKQHVHDERRCVPMRLGLSINYSCGFKETVSEVADLERAGLDIVTL